MKQIAFLCTICFLILVGCGAQKQAEKIYTTDYRVINFHTHLRGYDPAKILEVEQEVMDATGVDMVTNLNGFLMIDKEDDIKEHEENFLKWIEVREKYPNVLIFVGIDYSKLKSPNARQVLAERLEWMHEQGADGIKILKLLGMHHRDENGELYRIDDPVFYDFFEKAGELGMPVLIHVADPPNYWKDDFYSSWDYPIPDSKQYHRNLNKLFVDIPSYDDLIDQFKNVLRAHPKTNFVAAHMLNMSYQLNRLGEMFDEYPNLYVDTSARLRYLGRQTPYGVRDFFTKYQDRILFGTDASVSSSFFNDEGEAIDEKIQQRKYFYSRHLTYFETDRFDIVEPYGYEESWLRLAGCQLPEEVLKKIYWDNAAKLVKRVAVFDIEKG